jgi:hypothetical protein
MPDRRKFLVAWVGTAMYAAFAVGAPAGTILYAGYGFAAIALATTLIPLLTLLLVAPRRPVAAGAACPPCIRHGNRCGLGAGSRSGAQQCRVRRDHDVHRAALCTTWLGPGLARFYRVEHHLYGGASDLRPPAGQDRRRQGCVGLRADRSGRPGADLASALVGAGVVRGRGHGVRLLARLPRLARAAEISEIITHLAFYSGWANAMSAVAGDG